MDELVELLPDSTGAVEAPDVVSRRLGRMPLIQELGDSVAAAGGAWLPDSLRLVPTGRGILAYQPYWTLDRRGQPSLAAVGMARGDALSVGRSVEEALRGLAAGTTTRQGLAGDETLLVAARRLAAEADSALRQGDLEGFGRLFARLRALLQGEPEAP
jgi:hypothetical protein